MVTAVTSSHKQYSSQNQKRQPLLHSEPDNATPRRPKGRGIASRYLSISTSSSSSSNSSNTTTSSNTSDSWSSSIPTKRSQSPMVSSRAEMTTPISFERRRPAATTTQCYPERTIMTSVRSISVSFQGESFTFPVSKAKTPLITAATYGGARKDTPKRRQAGVTPVRDRQESYRENSMPSDQQQHRWPGRLRSENSSFLNRSLEYGSGSEKLSGFRVALKESMRSTADDSNDFKVGVQMKDACDNGKTGVTRGQGSGSSVGYRLNSNGESDIQLRGFTHGIVDPSKFLPEVLNPVSPASNYEMNKKSGTMKLNVAKKFLNDSPLLSAREVFPSCSSSPRRRCVRGESPSKAAASSLTGAVVRGIATPTRTRSVEGHLVNDNKLCITQSMLSFAAEVRKGKFGENRIDDAHDLRLLYNRLLQWRLANARSGNALLVQKLTAETSLYIAWMNTSKLWRSVKSKRIELQLSRQNLKLYSILKEQERHLENWGLLDRDHSKSLSGAIEALEACTVRLPVIGGARVDVQKVHGALSSSVDLMKAMASSILSLPTKAAQMNSLVSELYNLSARERSLLDEFKDLLSTMFIPLQVAHCSLMAIESQSQQVLTSSVKTTQYD